MILQLGWLQKPTAMGMSFDELVGTLNPFREVTVLGAENSTSLIRVATEINASIELGMSSQKRQN